MSSRIENLGDYNKVRIDLQNAGGRFKCSLWKNRSNCCGKSSSGIDVCWSRDSLGWSKGSSTFKKEKRVNKTRARIKRAI